MNKYVKWGIIGVVVLGFAGLGIYNFVPRENSELKEAPQKQKRQGQNAQCALYCVERADTF